jgi:hypothetical protein
LVFSGPPGEGYTDPRPDAFTITAQMLEEGEEDIVVSILTEVLGEYAAAAAAAAGGAGAAKL